MPKPYFRLFRENVVAVARRREPGVTIKQIADDFGISQTCLQPWLHADDVEAGRTAGVTAADAAETREVTKRIKLLEPEDEMLCRAAANLSQAQLPGKGTTRSCESSPPTGFPSR